MEFSEKLVLLRRSRGMTQTEMADLLGVTRQSVYKWENGTSYPEAMTLLAMREVFGVTLDALLDPAYVIRSAKTPAPIVTRVGEDFVPAADIAVEKVEEMPVKQGTTQTTDTTEDKATETETPATTPVGEESGEKKKKRGFFSRFFR